MKRAILIAVTLFLGACATAQPTLRTTYGLDASGNLVERQVLVPAADNGSSKVLESVAIIGLGIVGLYFVGELFDVWDDDKPQAAAAPVSPLVPSSGMQYQVTGFNSEFIAPVYQTVQ